MMEKERQSELMMKEVHKDYKKADATVEDNINTEAKQFAVNLDIEDRVFKMEKRKAMITIKDHKPGFMDNPKVRLINPTKSELGRAAKQMLVRRLEGRKKELNLKTVLQSNLSDQSVRRGGGIFLTEFSCRSPGGRSSQRRCRC